MELVVFLQDVTPAPLDEALVDVWPIAHLASLLVDRREPQRLAHGLERAEVAASADDAVVEGDLVDHRREHGLDVRHLPVPIKTLDLAPDELHPDGSLQHGLKRESERIKMTRLHVGSQHSGRVLE